MKTCICQQGDNGGLEISDECPIHHPEEKPKERINPGEYDNTVVEETVEMIKKGVPFQMVLKQYDGYGVI